MHKFVQCSWTCTFDCEIKWPSLGKSVKRLNACAHLQRPATSLTMSESLNEMRSLANMMIGQTFKAFVMLR